MLILYIFSGLTAFFATELAAWFAHKYFMHGIGWYFHKDHHEREEGFFEKNDVFFLIFAVPSWLCIMLGWIYVNWYSVGFGFGIAAYGIVYFLIHDVLIHRRFRWFDKVNTPYIKGIRMAHKVHHKNQGKDGGCCFSLLVVSKKYFKTAVR
jgi:beta-carotene 3-hydroxylase